MTEKKRRLPRYQRSANPPPMRLTARDKHIFEAIHSYDGMLGFSQLQRMFFSGKSQTERRLMMLYQNRYLNRPNQNERRKLPEMVYWLDKNGAEYVASLNGENLKQFQWRKQPRWFQVEHDLAVNDFRLNMVESCHHDQQVSLESWVPESEFWAYPDRIEYTSNGRKIKRNIRPDGFFILTTPDIRIRFLLEIDRGTEDNPRFLREKILLGLAYLKTEAYENRFGHRSGRWLVITTGERRMKNMLRQARRGNAKGIFSFTTYEQVSVSTLLHTPIWQRVDRSHKVPLLFID